MIVRYSDICYHLRALSFRSFRSCFAYKNGSMCFQREWNVKPPLD